MTRLEAIKNGSVFYDSKECKTCSGTKRYTSSGNCPVCNAKSVKEHRKKIKQAILQSKKLRGKSLWKRVLLCI